MAIYTKTGDKGTTSLANGERVTKTDVRIEAYGTVDELNSWLGLLRAGLSSKEADLQTIDVQLLWIQNRLFNLGAALSEAPGEWITDSDVLQLEQWIDAMQREVPRQNSFLLPSGNETVCQCHICRTICRRAERRMIEAKGEAKCMRFINRLSDYLFVLARYISFSQNEAEMAWQKDFCVEKLTE